uniref:Retrotransposon protein, putative, Ty1-copia subclass n=1 Tax=Tanacetum cinerariifolium TaxID=118510 RepID=A0A699HV78_TANCI|nr:retrotransposon protein, putative, Ty1-copia subclass [Tanacetum cinerariifolium]
MAIIDRQLPFEYIITSRSTDVMIVCQMALHVQNINHSAFKSMFEREKLSGNNFNDWFRQLKLVLRVEKKMLVIEQPIPPAPVVDSAANEGKSVDEYVLKMKGYLDQIERLGYVLPQDLSVSLILNGLIRDFAGFVRNYNMHNMGKTIGELHVMFIEYKRGLPKKAETPQIMAIRGGKIQKTNKKLLKAKGKGKTNGKENDKQVYISKPKNPKSNAKEHPAKNDTCHHCKEDYGISVSKNDVLYFNAIPSNGIYEIDMHDLVPNDYALEFATRILNMVPTKKDTPDKLQQRSAKCIFIGYPNEPIGYYFYFPPENKIIIAMYAEFFEKSLITQEVSGRAIDLEEIQDKDTSPSEITSEIPMEVEGFEPPQEEVILIRRSKKTHRNPTRLCLNVEADEHSLWDLNEPTSYKATILDLESNKWLDAMNAEMQSMIDNKVWVLIDLPLNCKTVGSKWVFKKKTDIDGIVHTYKARLVAKGYTQLYGVDYEETFSPVADIRAIRILIYISAFYDYEIWQMDVKTAFLNGYLNEDIYMVQPKVFVDPKNPRKVCKLQRSIYGLKQVSRSWNKRFDEEIKKSKRLIGLSQSAYMDKILKRYKMDNSKRGHIPMQKRLDLNKTQGASTPEEVKRMKNVPYASAVGSIMYAARWTSFKQSTTAMSATQAEYIATSKAAVEAIWIRKFISGLGIVPTIDEPIKMVCDNYATLLIANESRFRKAPDTIIEDAIMFASVLN